MMLLPEVRLRLVAEGIVMAALMVIAPLLLLPISRLAAVIVPER